MMSKMMKTKARKKAMIVPVLQNLKILIKFLVKMVTKKTASIVKWMPRKNKFYLASNQMTKKYKTKIFLKIKK